MKKGVKGALWLVLCALLWPQIALAEPPTGETDGDVVYTMVDEDGGMLMRRAGRIYEGDGLICADDSEYIVVAVDDEHCIAYAQRAAQDEQAMAVPVVGGAVERLEKNARDAAGGNKNDVQQGAQDAARRVICMYCTHSDESYEPTDGDYSLEKDAGIYDVSEAFARSLEALGVTVERSEETFLPHDSGAYRRSRATAAEYAKMMPSAIFDIHRDGIPDAGEYEETVDGTQIAQVRLLVGRSNENAAVNKSFAKQIKATADEKYPGLIRDIFIGKGNYNQELYPRALLLEFGTYSNDKERVLQSTGMMADAISQTLFGQSAPQQEEMQKEANAGAARGVGWTVGVLIVGALLYALISTGTLRNIGQKISAGAGEMTGGLIGRKKKDDK